MATIELGPDRGRLLINTGRSGLGRRAGHDLTIEAARWSGTLTLPGDATTIPDAEGGSVEVTVPVAGLEVREGTGGVLPLSDQDRTEITKNLRKVLDAARHPEITFTAPTATGSAAEFTVEGRLTVAGHTEPLTVRGRAEGARIRGEATVKQTRWGIKPYSAFFGALKLADDVKITFDLTL
ncbi:YceI family protein [Actinomadura rugatobispora]|uniref:YceI family protein n=1 Tax=Actinomadura rugatobispora TaxID=1994 RepID=A0ABW1AJ04_9ACTN|nr:YceI family protein [Actinomadura rugatobispora]